jgi:hypothetical protein
MAQDFDEAQDDTIYMVITPRKLRKWDLMAIALQGFSGVTGVVSDVFRDTAGMLLRHSEFEQQQHEVHQEMAWEIETIKAGKLEE